MLPVSKRYFRDIPKPSAPAPVTTPNNHWIIWNFVVSSWALIMPISCLPISKMEYRTYSIRLSVSLIFSSCTLLSSRIRPFSRFKSSRTLALIFPTSSLNFCLNFSISTVRRSCSFFVDVKSFLSSVWSSLLSCAKSTFCWYVVYWSALFASGVTLSCSSLVTIVRVRPMILSSMTSFRSSITACDCSGVKPWASSRWTTLSVSKFVALDGGDVTKWRATTTFMGNGTEVKRDGGYDNVDAWVSGCIIGIRRRHRSMFVFLSKKDRLMCWPWTRICAALPKHFTRGRSFTQILQMTSSCRISLWTTTILSKESGLVTIGKIPYFRLLGVLQLWRL